ncbi:uncharacterized protein LOC109839445 [Asparagus officinalis]|uniref:uncharacterized protein LOC109839445 n=1 Tax=Asparagus officinalis TaxID=4686 RepID=UPI00098E2A71|nr:uncharacterized protein LOC109839445 [Asparagus officinalis]
MDRWAGNNSLSSLFPKAFKLAFSQSSPVSSQGLWQNNIWRWNPILRRGISMEDKKDISDLLTLIDQIRPTSNKFDSIFWPSNPSLSFTVKSLYGILIKGGLLSPFHNFIWRSPIPLKVKTFLWILNKKKLQTKDNLIKKGWMGDSTCPLCSQTMETHDHLFITCQFTQAVWSSLLPSSSSSLWPQEVTSLINGKEDFLVSQHQKAIWKILFPCTCWCIWSSRNNLIFNNNPSLFPCTCWCIWSSRNNLIFNNNPSFPSSIAANSSRFVLFWTGTSKSKKSQRMYDAAIKAGLSEIAKSSGNEGFEDNFF